MSGDMGWGKVKCKPGAGINLLFSKIPLGGGASQRPYPTDKSQATVYIYIYIYILSHRAAICQSVAEV